MLAKLLSLLLTLLSLGQTAVDAYVNEACLGGNLFLVNRDFAIEADYVPNDLVTPKVLGGGEGIEFVHYLLDSGTSIKN